MPLAHKNKATAGSNTAAANTPKAARTADTPLLKRNVAVDVDSGYSIGRRSSTHSYLRVSMSYAAPTQYYFAASPSPTVLHPNRIADASI